MKKLEEHFGKIEKEVSALEKLVVFLFCLLAGYAIYLVYQQKIEDALKVFLPLGALISALLVAKVASRVLAHNNIVREDERRQDVVRISHHLLAVLIDLRQRVGISVHAFREGGIPPLFLIENADAIEKRYEVFLDREVYQFLSGETIELITKMSGHVFGFCVFTKTLADLSKNTSNAMLSLSEIPTSGAVIDSLELFLKDLEVLDDQIRQMRGALE